MDGSSTRFDVINEPSKPSGIIAYEDRLNADRMWALREGSMHFEKDSAVHKTLTRIARKLDELAVPYAIAGGMASYFHGYHRFTEDVDIVVTREGLAEIHERLEGLGYVPPFAGSKHLRDVVSGVRIEFLVAGTYPGDGKPKPVRFPDPADARCQIEGMSFLKLEKLIELKLISGTVPGRLKDLADVQELIRLLGLPRDFAVRLDDSVRSTYDQMWDEVQRTPPSP